VNLDDTNFVDWGYDDSSTMRDPARLYPESNWPTMFWLKPGRTLRLKADTASCKVYVKAYPTPA
jgi:hypothetical protein